MARNRVIYQSEELFVSKNASVTGSGDHKPLERIQSANYNFSITRQDINQYGMLGSLDRLMLEAPSVALDFSYYLTDGFNERALGFYVQTGATAQGGFLSGHLVEGSGKNFYILTSSEGTDASANSASTSNAVIGVGNAYLTNYTLDAAVGSIPTVSVSFEAANIMAKDSVSGSSSGYSGFTTSAITPADGTKLTSNVALPAATTGASVVTALRPGDVTIDISAFNATGLPDLTSGANGLHIQSMSLNIPLGRTPIQRLGTKFPFARAADFPVTATLSVSAIVNEIKASNLADIIADTVEKDVTITFKDQDGTGRAIYIFKGCTLDSQSFSSSIGSNKTVDLTFTTQMGSPSDTGRGVLVSGSNSTVAF